MKTQKKFGAKYNLRIRSWLCCLMLAVVSIIAIQPVQASLLTFLLPMPWDFLPGIGSKSGAVFSRAVVPGPNGKPVFVEYNGEGKIVNEIGEMIGEYERARIVPTSYYNSLLLGYQNVLEKYDDPKPVLLKASEYRSKAFSTVDGKAVTKPSLLSSTLYVVVSANQYLVNGSDLVLLELPIDPNIVPNSNSQSLLLSEPGEILYQTSETIGFKTGFFDKSAEISEDIRHHEATIYGPISGAKLDLGMVYPAGVAVTDSEGKYAMTYFIPPCPGFVWSYSSPILLELRYRRFNPSNSGTGIYYKTRMDYDVCVGTGGSSLFFFGYFMSTMASPMKTKFDFPIDLMILNGAAALAGVEVGDTTEYNGDAREATNFIQTKYDFDGDGKFDFVVPGKKVVKEVDGEQKEVFVQTAIGEAELQGIYLTSQHEKIPENLEEDGPDFTRLIDTAPDFQHRGLLSKISKEDLRDTDIYVFRESNGQLVAERRGLHESELYERYSGIDESAGSFRFTMHLRGEWEEKYAATRTTDFQTWQSAGGFAEEFQQKTANHLKAGETVRIVAVNRPTGYIGTKRVVLQAWSSSIYSEPTEQIQLYPPNLKVWAERTNQTEYGIHQGDQSKQMLSSEGAALSSDVSVNIYTEWLDQDGTPLPEALADYGYTGRLAKVVAQNQLAPVGANDLSQFQIKPGQQIQVIHLPERLLAKQHLYVQVAGQPTNRQPDFSSGDGAGQLKYRPNRYVPFAVPLFDEESTELARQAYLEGKKTDSELTKPAPTYVWQYRPEFQFSLYDLNVEEIRVTDADDVVHQILEEENPVLTSSDKLLEFYYTLLQSTFDELPAWGYEGSRQLVLAVGAEEIKATVGTDQTISFDNFDHLDSLSVDDYLTIRLYSNNDGGNILWEYAFDYLLLDAVLIGYNNQDDTTWYVTADDPTVELEAAVVGYENRADKEDFTLHWTINGQGSMRETIQQQNDTGRLQNLLTMPRKAGSEAVVSVRILESDATAKFKTVHVLPGLPARMEIETGGQASVMESEYLELVVKVFDAQGNPVADGTSVDLSADQPILVPEESNGTVDGVFRAKITGDAFAIPEGKLTITAGGLITQEIDFDVKRLNIALTSSVTTLRNNQESTLEVRVTKHDGSPAAGVLLTVGSNLGYFHEDQYATDANGIIRPVFSAGPYSGTGSWTFRAGFSGVAKEDFRVRPTTDSGASAGLDLDASQLMILGDKRDSSPIEYSRYDAQLIELDYSENALFKLTNLGNGSQTVEVKLGDLENPNLEPLLAYFMNHVEDEGEDDAYPGRVVSDIPDETGLRPAIGLDVEVVADHPMGKGYSYRFDGTTQIFSPIDQRLAQADQTGFRLDFKAAGNGEIFQLGNGQRLSFNGSTLRYEIETEAGTFAVEQNASLNTWHSVGGRYANGVLELQIDGQLASQPASGGIRYTGNRLLLGQGYNGQINSFKLYDWAAQPLVTFTNGQQSQSVTLAANGISELEVVSNRQLGLLQNDAAVRLVRVAITATGYQSQFVNVFSTDGYREIAGQYLEIFTAGGPEYLAAGLNFQQPPWYSPVAVSILNYVVPPAYAWSWQGIWNGVKTAVNFIVPIEDFAMLGKQLYYLASADWENFSATELALAALGVITVIPMMKPLKIVLVPLKKFMRTFGNKPIVKAIGGVVGRIAEEAAKGRTEKLISLLPYFLIMVEIIQSGEEALEVINVLVDGIESADDLWAWIDYFNLPANGWEGEEIPAVASALSVRGAKQETFLDSMIPKAYAARRKSMALRQGGDVILNALRTAVRRTSATPKDLTLFAKQIPRILRDTQAGIMRRVAHDPASIGAGVNLLRTVGGNSLRNLFTQKPNDRIDRRLLVALMAYIEYGINDGTLHISHSDLAIFLRNAFLSDANTKYGYAFQVLMVAYFHLLNQEMDGLPVLEIEQDQKQSGLNLSRRVDIVLGDGDYQVWVEVKSLAWRYSPSSFERPGKGYNKEFTADFKGRMRSDKKIEYIWRFHSFKTKNQSMKGPTKSEFNSFNVENRFCDHLSVAEISNAKSECKKYKTNSKYGDVFNLQTMSAVLGDVARSPKFTDAFKEILEQIVPDD